MKVLFVNPPTYEEQGSFNRPIRFPSFNYATPVLHPPLLLAYAASYVRSLGHEVSFIDAPVENLSVSQFIDQAGQIAPQLIVMETSTPSFKNDISVASEVKQKLGCKVIFVGPHVSALPMESMRETCLDAVIVGEYELSLGEYLNHGGEGAKGVCYRKNGQVILSPGREYIQDLDKLPFPARDLLPNNKYFDPILKNPFTFVLGGRGCPFRCTFCNWPQVLTGRHYRFRSANNIVDELETIVKKYQFRSFLFNDDTFTASPKHTIEVCDEMMRRGIKVPWACYSRADNTDEVLLSKLREAGCFLLKVGLESGNQQILDNMHKLYKLENVKKGVSLMKSLGFQVHGTFVFGMPGENKQSIEETIRFAKKLKPTTVQFSTAVPYPGAEFHHYLSEQGYLLTQDWDEYMPMHPIFEYPDLKASELTGAVRRAYRRYYFTPQYFGIGLKKMVTEPRTVLSNLKKLVKLAF